MPSSDHDLVDTALNRSVSFAPQEPTSLRVVTRGPRVPLPVGPGRAAIVTPSPVRGELSGDVMGYPIQPGKVQQPVLRPETLARTRLLDWLNVKIHNRVVFVVAEAGYGKTTLLADFARRSRLRTLWYRMDSDDRDWVGFLSHLVAAGREHDAGFAPRTSALLRDQDPGGPALSDVLDAFFGELPTITADGAALIFDDFHVAEDSVDIKLISRELVLRAPERLTLVFASRREPVVPVARIRALGELAELTTRDLLFSPEETEQLFRETYQRPLEPDVLADLNDRTEGWAASLSLVHSALRDRSPSETRRFVRALSGAQGNVHDFLAEEVVAKLSDQHRDFLMRTSLLQSVAVDTASVISQQDRPSTLRLLAASERLGLLARRVEGGTPRWRYHPLVREFLADRVLRDLGAEQVASLHATVGMWAEGVDWRTASFHFAAANLTEALHRVIDTAIESIVASGDIQTAAEFLDAKPPDADRASFAVIRSRLASRSGDLSAAVLHAELAAQIDPRSDSAISTLIAMYFTAGHLDGVEELASQLHSSATSETLREIGELTNLVLRSSTTERLDTTADALNRFAARSAADHQRHYQGVALLNLALVQRAMGDAQLTYQTATHAQELFESTGPTPDLASAQLARAWALAHQSRIEDARVILGAIASGPLLGSRGEYLIEAADIELWYGSRDSARSLIEEVIALELSPSLAEIGKLTRSLLMMRDGDYEQSSSLLASARMDVLTQEPGHLSRLLTQKAMLALLTDSPQKRESATSALAFAEKQGAGLWLAVAQVLLACATARGSDDVRLVVRSRAAVSMAADVVVRFLGHIDDDTRMTVRDEAAARPDRWLPALRAALVTDQQVDPRVAGILDEVGAKEDIPTLRGVARLRQRGIDPALGRRLARRLAPRVFVEDQGRVEVKVGPTSVPGTDLRRKVLAMLCFLISRSKFSATRDEVVDALWPDMDPRVAVNSLNQTVYFLRRVFESPYREDLSPGYVHHDSDVLWLDRDLISTRSQQCSDLVESIGVGLDPDVIDALSDHYLGKFALDFAYEDWAVDFRESLHVAYVQAVESAVIRDLETGHLERGQRLARRALQIDPDLENVQVLLVRLYRASGSYAAASEQYARYSAMLKEEFGVEAPPLESL